MARGRGWERGKGGEMVWEGILYSVVVDVRKVEI